MKKVDPYYVISDLKKNLDFARMLIVIAAWLGFVLGLVLGKFII